MARTSSRKKVTRLTVLYLVLSPTCTLLSTLIGSLSEYRFPHPLFTTTLHLLISLLSLFLLSSLSRLSLHLLSRSFQRPLASPKHTLLSSFSLLSQLASFRPLPPLRALPSHLTPLAISAALSATLATLIETRASRITEPSFWSLARLLPLFYSALFLPSPASPSSTEVSRRTSISSKERFVGLIAGTVLLSGNGIAFGASGEGWMCGLFYAAGVTAWIACTQAGFRESEGTGTSASASKSSGGGGGVAPEVRSSDSDGLPPPPTAPLHLLLVLLFLLIPLLLSSELSLAYTSSHFSFFTEPTFYLQESLLSLLSLLSLFSFYALLPLLNPIKLFLLVAIKDIFLVPWGFHFFLGNYLENKKNVGLGVRQQVLILGVMGVLWVADSQGVASNPGQAKVSVVGGGEGEGSVGSGRDKQG